MKNTDQLTTAEMETPPDDPRFAQFGAAVWAWIKRQGGDFCGEEMSEEILPLAQAAGLCSRVIYDPAIHGDNIEADPGCEIWWWGVERNVRDQGHLPGKQDSQSTQRSSG
jgi:hypothetical protein